MTDTRVLMEKKKRDREKQLAEKHRLTKIRLANEEKVPVSIPMIYKDRLGSNLPLSLNTEIITIPVNGKTYMIPKSFAVILKNHLKQIDIEAARSSQRWGDEKGDVSATGPIPGIK